MANYTIEVNKIIENLVLQKTGKSKYEFDSHKDMIDIATPLIFDKYPLFDEEHRLELNRKIISYYYMREICVVPWQRWRFFINEELDRVMPYYNLLYANVAKEFDLFDNVNYTETLDRDLSGNQTHENKRTVLENDDTIENKKRDLTDEINTEQSSTNDLSSDTSRVFEDTPISQLGSTDYATDVAKEKAKDIEKGSQAGKQNQKSNLSDINSTIKSNEIVSDSENVSSTSNTENYVKTFKGKNSAISNIDLIVKARQAIINIDEMIIKSLESNFSGYYN